MRKVGRIITIIFAVIGFVGSIFTILGISLKKNIKELSFEILADNNVFELKNDLPDLQILYQNKNLRYENETIRFLKLKIENTGTIPITESDFDKDFPIGILLSSGEILEPPAILETSDDQYFKKKIKIIIDSTNRNKLYFSTAIIDKGSYFTFKVIVKHKIDTIPTIIPLGKIAGIKKLYIQEKKENDGKENISTDLYQKLIYVMISYGVVFILLQLYLQYRRRRSLSSYGSTEDKKLKIQEETIKDFFIKEPNLTDETKEFLSLIYLRGGKENLEKFKKIITDSNILKKFIEQIVLKKKEIDDVYDSDLKEFKGYTWFSRYEEQIEYLLEKKFVSEENDTYHIDPSLAEAIVKFDTFLKYKK